MASGDAQGRFGRPWKHHDMGWLPRPPHSSPLPPETRNSIDTRRNTIFYLLSMLFRCRETFGVAQRRGAFFVISLQHQGGKQRTAVRIA